MAHIDVVMDSSDKGADEVRRHGWAMELLGPARPACLGLFSGGSEEGPWTAAGPVLLGRGWWAGREGCEGWLGVSGGHVSRGWHVWCTVAGCMSVSSV